jgi:hypothetical protein
MCPFAKGGDKTKCYAYGKKCKLCLNPGHFGKMCKTNLKPPMASMALEKASAKAAKAQDSN